jgi:hypothetical protein
MTSFKCYKYPLNQPSKGFTIFLFGSIHILILRTFIIQKQEQTLLFLKFKTHSLIYYNLLLKSHELYHLGSLNPTKRDYFIDFELFTANHLLHKF